MIFRLKHSNVIHILIRFLVAALLVLAVLYVYFLCASIRNVVMRKELERDIASLSSSIGELEASYFALEGTIGVATAERLGLAKLEDTSYTPRYSTRGSVTLNE
jgi:hypothetical protein